MLTLLLQWYHETMYLDKINGIKPSDCQPVYSFAWYRNKDLSCLSINNSVIKKLYPENDLFTLTAIIMQWLHLMSHCVMSYLYKDILDGWLCFILTAASMISSLLQGISFLGCLYSAWHNGLGPQGSQIELDCFKQ